MGHLRYVRFDVGKSHPKTAFGDPSDNQGALSSGTQAERPTFYADLVTLVMWYFLQYVRYFT